MPLSLLKKRFFLSLSLLLLFSFLLPDKALALACVFSSQRNGPITECNNQDQINCATFCGFKKLDGFNCQAEDNFPSCNEWAANQEAIRQAAEAEKQRAEAARLEAEKQKDAEMVCICQRGENGAMVADGSDQIEGQSTLRPPEIFDGIEEDLCTSAEQLQRNNLFNCAWAPRGSLKPILDNAVDNAYPEIDKQLSVFAEAKSKQNPLLKFKDDVSKLNKIKANDAQELIGLAIKTVMGIMGTIALSMIIYGGVLWMTAMGNSSQSEKALDIIFWAALGIFVIFGSYALVNFIFEAANPTLQTG